MNFMLCAAGAFQLWRRDLVEDLHGWSAEFTCEDIEFTFRAHRVLREQKRRYRIVCLPDCVGVTEGPDSVRNLVSQRERWQRVILETCWANRRMWFNPRYGKVGMIGVPYYLVSEIVAPVFELLAVGTLAVGGVAGLIAWWQFAVLTLLIACANSALTTGALLMLDLEARSYRPSAVARLLALMPVEMVVYRPLMAWARLKGTWRFLRGDRAWHKFERNVRAETA
jgi:cellulose synthase/poly-beta-1,6-N-acetylglucosamine synthase-like glycosyltransferase